MTLRRQEGKEDVLLRADIEAMAGSGQSLMPEGLEKDLTPQRPRRPDRLPEGDRTPRRSRSPATIPSGSRPGPDGSIVLRAETAEISRRHPDLRAEARQPRLLERQERPRRLAVRGPARRPLRRLARLGLRRPHRRQHAGRSTLARTGSRPRSPGPGAGRPTGPAAIGEVTLAAGPQRLEIRPVGPIRGALLDLRAVELRPVETAVATNPPRRARTDAQADRRPPDRRPRSTSCRSRRGCR